MRGANCWTDHKMVRAKLRAQLPHTSGSRGKKSVPFAVHELCSKAKRDEYADCLEGKRKTNGHCLEKSLEHNWTTVILHHGSS